MLMTVDDGTDTAAESLTGMTQQRSGSQYHSSCDVCLCQAVS